VSIIKILYSTHKIIVRFVTETEFRLLIETNPNYKDLSPTTRCTPDFKREQSRKRSITLRTQSEEIKKVWQNFITQSVFSIHNSISDNSFLESQKSNFHLNFTTEASSTKHETDTYDSRQPYMNSINDHLIQKTIDEKLETPPTPETPSFANLSINEKIQESISFSSSVKNESCEGIFDFECELFASDVCNESIFCNDDPFFVDEC
jgi:hypothetical protein